jgi:hypothetical protein
MSEKKKYFRILPLLGGLLALLVSFIASIPLGSWMTLSFHILESAGTYYYVWGIVEGGSILEIFTSISVENLIPLIFWIFLVLTAIFGFVGTSFKENPHMIKKLLILGGFIVFIEIAYFTTLYILNLGTYTFGYGFYGLILISILYFISSGLVTDYQKM